MIQVAIVSGTDQIKFEDDVNRKLVALQNAGHFVKHIRFEQMPDGVFAYITFNLRSRASHPPPNEHPTDHGHTK
jgi:hypothetical protein